MQAAIKFAAIIQQGVFAVCFRASKLTGSMRHIVSPSAKSEVLRLLREGERTACTDSSFPSGISERECAILLRVPEFAHEAFAEG